jgi:hypothetical protein
MNIRQWLILQRHWLAYCLMLIAFCISSCTATKSSFHPTQKYSSAQLLHDYEVYEDVLKNHHPSLYWYTPADSMRYYFAEGRKQLTDSLTEPQFRKVLAWVTAKINCGHTTLRSSKKWSKFADTAKVGNMFPLTMKIWNNSGLAQDEKMVVIANLHRRDSIFKRGTEILSINGIKRKHLVDTMFEYISTDGYNTTHKYQTLSNRGNFGSLYTMLYGLPDKYEIEWLDSTGQKNTNIILPYRPAADTPTQRGTRTFRQTMPKPTKQQLKEMRLNAIRLLQIDSTNKTAMMNLGSFAKGYQLKKFFHNSFKTLQQNKVGHLIIDLRSNGGGSVSNSTLITKYLINKKFKLADSLFATATKSVYRKHINSHFWNGLFYTFFTKKKGDGMRHFGYYERHYFTPKKKNHFNGKVYILTGGNSFSASTLLASALIKQDNVTVVGEETGGGAYGNSAWLIPDVTLPNTGVRCRLPLFRLVIDKTVPKIGKGVQPEVPSMPTVELIKKNTDYKVQKVMELITAEKQR